jgi:hypothetical protein
VGGSACACAESDGAEADGAEADGAEAFAHADMRETDSLPQKKDNESKGHLSGLPAGCEGASGRVILRASRQEGALMVRTLRLRQWGRLALVAALVGFVAQPGEALAQSSNGASLADSARSEEAAALFREGTRAASAGLWKKARLAFAAAFERKQHWQIAAHLGRAELQTGHYRDAAEHLSYFLREAEGVPEADLTQSRAMLDQALAKVSAVTVRVNVDGAEVFVDGRSVGRSPLPGVVYVDPGRRTFEAKRDGYGGAAKAEEMRAGAAPTVELSLEKSSAEMVVTTSSTAPRSATAPGRLTTRTIALGSAAGVLLVSGIAFGIASQITSDERDKYDRGKTYDDPEQFRDLERQRIGLAGTSFYSFIGFGLAAGATAASVMVDLASAPGSSTKVGLQATANGLGAMVAARW